MYRRTFLHTLAASGVAAALPGVANATTKEVAEQAPKDNSVVQPLLPPTNGPVPVAFLLAEGAVVVDFAGPWGVFEYVNTPATDYAPFQLYTVSESPSPIKVSGGMIIVPNYTLDNAPQPKIIVVPAMGEPSEAMLAWLRKTSKGTDLTMSVCTGSFILAKAGLLSGKEATTHHSALTLFTADFHDIKVKRGARFVDAGDISTAGGLTSGVDLALHVVERYYGRKVAEDTATWLEYQGQGWKNPNSNFFPKNPVSTEKHSFCPVCGMEVNKKTAPNEVYREHKYYFCSEEDKKRFDQSPEKFIGQ